MKKAKLGTKIVLGFCALIFIAMALGGMAVWNMKSVVGESSKLAKEFVPEVQVANEIERHSLVTMYNMMGYAWSQREDYLKNGREQFGAGQRASGRGQTARRQVAPPGEAQGAGGPCHRRSHAI